MNDNILVSISCTTYNHEGFIADAIESFLMQKTNFTFEILIHDDASTDGTADIIREYEKKFPNLIKPIYQTENQYSKGVKVGRFNRERARGKYIALCEGDDYWIDPLKLQKQVDYMESHPKCTLCFHNAVVVNNNGSKVGKLHIPWSVHNSSYFYNNDTIYQVGELALLDFIPTASLLYPTHLAKSLPKWHQNAIVGDAPLRLTLTSYGYAYYINDIMSAYRINVEGSATDRSSKLNEDKNVLIDRLRQHIKIIDYLDKDTNYKYSDQLDQAKIAWEVRILEAQMKFKELNKPRYKTYYDTLGKGSKIKLYIRSYFPTIYRKMIEFKKML